MLFDFFTYKNETIDCKKCKWNGMGNELIYGEFSETGSIVDLDCPSCHETLGYIQFPLKKDLDKWKLDNPGIDTGWGNI